MACQRTGSGSDAVTDHPAHPISHEDRLQELIDVVVAIASFQFDRRASVGREGDILDGLAVGINMLAEEIGTRVARDQLYQRQLAQNERLIAVGQLAAGIAHEVNNPAAYVMANLQMVDHTLATLIDAARAGRLTPEDVAQQAEQARLLTRENLGGLERIVAIVRELRQFTHGGADVVEPVDLSRVIADACALVRSEVVFRATLDVHVPERLVVRGDRTKLTQVFTNLLLNAAQAIPEASPRPEQIVIEATRDGQLISVCVRDTGSGITDDVRPRLFEPFFTTKPRDLGTGLGLVISADIVRAHGGELRLRETSPAGTTFEVRLPLLTGPVELPRVTPQFGVRRPRPLTRRPRVLLVDDEAQVLAAYRGLLGEEYDVHIAASGREAIERLTLDQDWDTIVCDVMMPELDGTAVHDWVSAHVPALEPRVLFCTGGAFSPRGVVLTERHAARLLQKPFTITAFREAVARVAMTA
ncbi:MAG: response regulator [Gemmatimonadaceae bacterium]|nr:response regulator [Gemmatimonadaceae bacterium]